jgi:hypothetical protein
MIGMSRKSTATQFECRTRLDSHVYELFVTLQSGVSPQKRHASCAVFAQDERRIKLQRPGTGAT